MEQWLWWLRDRDRDRRSRDLLSNKESFHFARWRVLEIVTHVNILTSELHTRSGEDSPSCVVCIFPQSRTRTHAQLKTVSPWSQDKGPA